MSIKSKKKVIQTIVNILLLIVAFIYLLPFFWMVSTSLRPMGDSYKMPPSFFPTSFDLSTYKALLTNSFPYLMTYKNSLLATLGVMCGQLVVCTMAAYSFSCIRYPGRNLMFGILLTAMMMPIQITLIPNFVLMSRLKLINTLWSIILPYCSSVFGIFLLRQFFMSVPISLVESAKLDGAGHTRIFIQIMLPLVKPALATMVIYGVNQSWNNYFAPLLYLNKWEKMTLPLGMVVMKENLYNGLGCVMAGITMAIVPIFILFIFCQQYFIEGVSAQGIKG